MATNTDALLSPSLDDKRDVIRRASTHKKIAGLEIGRHAEYVGSTKPALVTVLALHHLHAIVIHAPEGDEEPVDGVSVNLPFVAHFAELRLHPIHLLAQEIGAERLDAEIARRKAMRATAIKSSTEQGV